MSSAIAHALPVMISAMVTKQNSDEDTNVVAKECSARRASSAPPPRAGGLSDSSDDEFCFRPTSSNASTSAQDEAESTNDDTTSSGTPSSKPRWADDDTDEEFFLYVPPPKQVTETRIGLSALAQQFVPATVPAAVPCWPVMAMPTLTPEARHGFASVVAAGLGALRRSKLVEHSEVQEGTCGWNLYCTVRADDGTVGNKVDVIAEEVQRALLATAEASDDTYVVGYDATPFAPVLGKFGFSANLARVRDVNNACWDGLTRGRCKRGHACRWQHPAEQVLVEVIIDV